MNPVLTHRPDAKGQGTLGSLARRISSFTQFASAKIH